MYENKQNPTWRKRTSYSKFIGNVFSILENNPGAEKTRPLPVYFASCQHRKYKNGNHNFGKPFMSTEDKHCNKFLSYAKSQFKFALCQT